MEPGLRARNVDATYFGQCQPNRQQAKLLRGGHVFTTTDFIAQDEANIEDLVGADLYIDVVNEAYNLKAGNKLKAKSVSALMPETPRVVLKVEAAFKVMPDGVPEFNHYSPSAWLIQNPATLKREAAAVLAALDRFEAMFVDLNKLLPAH